MESGELSVRDTLAYTVPSMLKILDNSQNTFYVLQNLQCSNSCNDRSLMCALDKEANKVIVFVVKKDLLLIKYFAISLYQW